MNYDELRAYVIKSPISEGATSPCRWKRLYLNERSGAIFPAAKWVVNAAIKEHRSYTEKDANFYFMKGDICVINKIPLSTFTLVPFGLQGRFIAHASPKSEYTYVYDFFKKYESYDGMRLDMRTGRPIGTRLLDDIEYDHERLNAFRRRLHEMRCVLGALYRMDPNAAEDRLKLHINKHETKMRRERRTYLVNLFSKPLDDQWCLKTEKYIASFVRRSYSSDFNPKRAFDNMIRFDKAALFRALRIVT